MINNAAYRIRLARVELGIAGFCFPLPSGSSQLAPKMSAVSKIFTKRKRKGNPTPPSGSNSATTSDAVELDINKNHDKFLKYLDPVIEVLNVTKEASEMLPPLKLACGVTIRILSLVRVCSLAAAQIGPLIKISREW